MEWVPLPQSREGETSQTYIRHIRNEGSKNLPVLREPVPNRPAEETECKEIFTSLIDDGQDADDQLSKDLGILRLNNESRPLPPRPMISVETTASPLDTERARRDTD